MYELIVLAITGTFYCVNPHWSTLWGYLFIHCKQGMFQVKEYVPGEYLRCFVYEKKKRQLDKVVCSTEERPKE